MVELIAAGIIIQGGPTGVWSPSHPHLYPTEIIVPSIPSVEPSVYGLPPGYVPYEEPPFNPGPYTYDDGSPIVL